jgi:sugar O-acyltransferase (sialic acid O-acetyltransferase NeuD family)
MNELNLLIIGAGGHARSCIDVIEQQGQYHIIGLVGTATELGKRCLGYPIIATDNELQSLAERFSYAFLAVGHMTSPEKRIHLHELCLSLGFIFPTLISPSAYVSPHATIGAGTIVMPGAIVNAAAKVGRNCIINSRTLIEHDATVEDHSHISTGAIINGGARVGFGSFVGSGSIVRDGRTLGEKCVIGMGLAVRHDQPNGTKFTG